MIILKLQYIHDFFSGLKINLKTFFREIKILQKTYTAKNN